MTVDTILQLIFTLLVGIATVGVWRATVYLGRLQIRPTLVAYIRPANHSQNDSRVGVYVENLGRGVAKEIVLTCETPSGNKVVYREVRMWVARRIEKPLGVERDLPLGPDETRVKVTLQCKDEEGRPIKQPPVELDTTGTILFGQTIQP